MTAVVLDGRTLAPGAVAAVARDGATVELDGAARARNAAAAGAVDRLLEAGTPIYGVSTGVGTLRRHSVPPHERPGQQLLLLRSHACGAGPLLAPEIVRAAMTVRANQIGAGGAGVSDGLIVALVAALSAGFTPCAHELGSLGTADLSVLSEIALALLGEGRAWRDGQAAPAAELLGAAGLVAPVLGPRDGIGFMSSGAASIGHAALVASDSRRLLDGALAVSALSFLAAGADPASLDSRVHAARGHQGQVAVALRLRELLGSDAAAARELGPRAAIHDPYPFRALGQVEGATLEALEGLEAVLAAELNGASENALIDDEEPAALPTGNFHGGALALALDRLRAALAQSSSLGAARVTALLDPGLMGLPAALAANPGRDHGAMMLEYTAHAAAADVRLRASPVSAQTTAVGGGMESHASFAPFAAREADAATGSAAIALATELVVALRALRLRGFVPSGGEAASLYRLAARELGDDMADRVLSGDIEMARTLLLRHRYGAP